MERPPSHDLCSNLKEQKRRPPRSPPYPHCHLPNPRKSGSLKKLWIGSRLRGSIKSLVISSLVRVSYQVPAHSADLPAYRTRYYWRRSSGVGPRPAQVRDWHRCFWQTETYRQRHFRVEKATASPSTRANFPFQQLVLPLKKCQFGSGVFAQQLVVVIIARSPIIRHELQHSRRVLPV